ncbi:MAG TPA: CinA family nicotinamide mononucleotide deamidase-related protein [Thermoanaerobaculia bacterium]|nr:CinA family nicotinamide mononucleotide deamidase-related protein [Thermoanaerobaculia bacterium]
MKAAIVAIGSEMLGPTRLDSNSLHMTRVLERYGVTVERKEVLPDDVAVIIDVLRDLADRYPLLLISGGLGPTEDDLTREAVAEAFGLRLEEDPTILTDLERKFRSRGLAMPQVNQKQALVFHGQRTLMNPRGTAPGFHLNLARQDAQRHVWVFPGVPWELEGLLENELEPWLKESMPDGRGIFRRVIKVTGMSESAVDEKLQPFYRSHQGRIPVTMLATRAEIQVHLQARGTPDRAYSDLTAMEMQVREFLGERIYGVDDDLIEEVIGRLLISRGETLAVAESCTGGLLGSRITDVSGSSAYFMGGIVAYSGEAKVRLLEVDPAAIGEQGEVSEEVARQMAAGVRRHFGTTWGIAITGIAGPTGGTPAKPVGTVHLAVAGTQTAEQRMVILPPPRDRIKNLASQAALDVLRIVLLRTSAG